MSMPSFPPIDPELNIEKSISMILYSIALEVTAISHVINAEGEKIKYATEYIKRNCCDMQEIIDLNKSTEKLFEKINDTQLTLKNKMYGALEYAPKPLEPDKYRHEHHHYYEEDDYIYIPELHHENLSHHEYFYAKPNVKWKCGTNLFLLNDSYNHCKNNSSLFLEQGIYYIKFQFNLSKCCYDINDAKVKFLFNNNENVFYSVDFHEHNNCGLFKGGFIFQTPECDGCTCSINLKSPCCVIVNDGEIVVTKVG
jgi:hypothetical protein